MSDNNEPVYETPYLSPEEFTKKMNNFNNFLEIAYKGERGDHVQKIARRYMDLMKENIKIKDAVEKSLKAYNDAYSKQVLFKESGKEDEIVSLYTSLSLLSEEYENK